MIHSILHVIWEEHIDWAVGSLGGGLHRVQHLRACSETGFAGQSLILLS